MMNKRISTIGCLALLIVGTATPVKSASVDYAITVPVKIQLNSTKYKGWAGRIICTVDEKYVKPGLEPSAGGSGPFGNLSTPDLVSKQIVAVGQKWFVFDPQGNFNGNVTLLFNRNEKIDEKKYGNGDPATDHYACNLSFPDGNPPHSAQELWGDGFFKP
jgi:hypothetical protein